jgi:hypothetical protein
MPRALPLPLREQIVRCHQQGQPLQQIALQLNLSYRSVCHCWQRYRVLGEAGLHNNYSHCGAKQTQFSRDLQQRVLALKKEHPRWGAPLIRLNIRAQFPQASVPSTRTLQRWFAQEGLTPVRYPRPHLSRPRGQHPHDVWQVDAKERMRLDDGTGASVLNVTDEASGAALGATVFPPLPLGASCRHVCAAGVAKPV